MSTTHEIFNRGGLMTVDDGDGERCLGYLMNFKEKGIYEPSLGLVDVTALEAETHNALLSKAEIQGLDENCRVGMYGTLYFTKGKVHTWIGEVVSEHVVLRGPWITFVRYGKVFRGRLQKGQDCFNFKRVK